MARNHYVASARVPSTPRELADVMSDPSRMQEFTGGGAEEFDEFTNRYIENANRNGHLDRLIAEASQLETARILNAARGQGGALPVGDGGGQRRDASSRRKLYNKNALGAQVDHLFAKSAPDTLLGDFTRAIWDRNRDGEDIRRQLELSASSGRFKNLSERVPAGGGFLVPEVLRADVLQMILENSIVRPRARVIQMDSLRVPIPTIDETSHVSSVYGGVTAFWTEEGAALTATQPSFGRTVLEAKKLTAYTSVPNELLADAVVLTEWMAVQLPQAVAYFEDVAFISGSGAGQPQGFLNAPCAVVTGGGAAGARAGGAGAAVAFSDVVAMYARLLPMSMRSAVWLCSPDVLPGLLQMTVTGVNTVSSGPTTGPMSIAPPLWLSNMSAADGYPGGGNGDGRTYELLGRPLIVSEKMPALNGQGALALFDPSFYLIGQRQEITASMSEHFAFANDLTVFRWIERCDGRTWIQSALTPEDGSANTLSPVVLLHA